MTSGIYSKNNISTTTHADLECAYGVVGEGLLISDGDLEWAEGLGPSLRPVLLALDLASLLQVRYHDNCRGPLLPHQTPKVNVCLWKRTCHEISV